MNKELQVILATLVIALSGNIAAAKEPPPYESYAEEIAPSEELSVITTLGGAAPQSVRFIKLDDEFLGGPKDEMILTPGCRCTCVMADLPPAKPDLAILVPMCIETRPGHTYIISSEWGWNASIWVNEWPTETVSGKLLHRKYSYTNMLFFKKKEALFLYKFRANNEFVPTKKYPNLAYCAETQPLCGIPVIDADAEER